jgi:hypothetical protein
VIEDQCPANAPCKDCAVATTDGDRRVQMFRDNKYQYTLCYMCDRTRRATAYATTGVLTTRLWLDLTLDHREQWDNPTLPFLVSMARVKLAAAGFGREVWFDGGLQEFFRESKYAAFSMGDTASGFKLLMLSSAGRALFTFEASDEHSVTLITDASSVDAKMGVQGIDATEAVALSLIAQGTALWKSGARPVVEREVGFGL